MLWHQYSCFEYAEINHKAQKYAIYKFKVRLYALYVNKYSNMFVHYVKNNLYCVYMYVTMKIFYQQQNHYHCINAWILILGLWLHSLQ